jgi:diaminohydroxyphosphoribosylaminopyrimidine deaminase/5-amino-6-(5-phosphoribosylamino)uracil reductase
MRKKGAELLAYDGPGELPDLKFLLDALGQRGIQQILVEGGPHMAASFLRAGLVDEMCVYVAPKILGAGGTAPISEPMAVLEQVVGLHRVQIKALGDDVRISGRLQNSPAPEQVRASGNPLGTAELT